MLDGEPQTIGRDDTGMGIMTNDEGIVDQNDREQWQSRRITYMYTLGTKLVAQAYEMILGNIQVIGKFAFLSEIVAKGD